MASASITTAPRTTGIHLATKSGNGRNGKLTSKGVATRARLLSAAEDVFGDVGFDRASVSEITRRSGVAQGTFYLYFTSKQEVFSELVREIGRNIRHEISVAIEGLTSRADIERRGFEAFFEHVSKHPSIYRIVRQAEFVDREAFRDYYEGFAKGYVDGLRRAEANGEVNKIDPEVVAWCLMGMGDLVGVRWILLREEGKVPKKVLDAMIRLISEGVIVQDDKTR